MKSSRPREGESGQTGKRRRKDIGLRGTSPSNSPLPSFILPSLSEHRSESWKTTSKMGDGGIILETSRESLDLV